MIDAAGLTPSGQSITGWTDLLGQATGAGQVHGIASAVLEDDDGAVARLHQFLESAANWYDERGDQTSSRHYRGVADQFSALADEMVRLSEDLARAAHRRRRESAPASGPAAPLPANPPAPRRGAEPPRR